ncbi:MAG TPA: translocation/assembly module TamB domain-containing protein [Burkholderiaceae bacterium]|nr:translocation/assembly module TamB domain-containing protein [Burkholderiaceae bacterium]
MSAQTPPLPHRMRGTAVLVTGLLIALALAGGIVALVVWLLQTTSGLTTMARVATALTPVRVRIESPQGSVRYGFAIGRLTVAVGTTEVDIHDLRATLIDFGIQPMRFDFSMLAAASVDVRVRPGNSGPSGPTSSIASPVAVSATQLQVSEFALRVGADPEPTLIAARAIDGEAAIGPDGYRIGHSQFEFGRVDAPLRATAHGTLGGALPFPLRVDGTLSSSFQDKPLDATLSATGSLERFVASGQVSSSGAKGSFAVTIGAFATPALQEIHADLLGIDPRVWSATALRADLHVLADLKPTEGAQFGLAGNVRVENKIPGPIDANQIPVRSATAAARWSGDRLELSDVAAALVRGSARGTFALQFAPKVVWETQARLSAVDPSTIHRKLRPLRIDGDVTARQDGADTLVVADLRNQGKLPVTLKVDLRLSPAQLAINSGRLVLGGGTVDVVGEMELTGTRRVHVSGNAHALDPSLLVEGAKAKLTGIFALDAHLEPQVSGDLDFELTDSAAFGRPLAGRGTASLSSAQQLTVDLDLTVHSARVRASGGLGAPDRTMTVDVEAPALDELALPVKGGLSAHATLSGDWRAPSIDARAEAINIAYGAHGIESVRATLTYAGGTDGTFSLHTDLTGHHWTGNPAASVRAASLVAEGRPSAHTLSLYASYEEDQTARIAATGGWSELRWRGQITDANMGAPLDLRLLDATAIEIDQKGGRLGPARLVLAGATVSDLSLDVRDGLIVTSGAFDELRPGDLIRRRQTSMIPRGARDPLALRGRWRIRAGDVVDGELSVERVSGDMYATAGNDAPMGVTDLSAHATVRANRIEAVGDLRGARLGSLHATLAASLERDPEAGWRLAQTRPWRIDAAADLPSIEWVNALLSDRVRSNIRIGGKLNGKMMINGTPAKPEADGHIEGTDLRVAWIEQGVRLENGHLAVRVDEEGLVLDELQFSGPPRVKPNDARTAKTMTKMESGHVTATGKLRLPDLTGVIQIRAEHVPLLQRADRWVVATGGANVELAPKRIQLNGAVTVDAGFIDFTHPDLPTLSSDVTVIETSTAQREREPRMQLGFDLGLDLGPAMYLHGAGLDTRLAGAVRVRSDGKGIIRASGEVNAVDGVYQGYGQKLKISRGRINFQGALDNPGLDILALRPDLPQDAGDIGISITRTATNPLIQLYSDPELTEYQTLSWLVLGRPADQSGADNAALARAAVGLLAGSGDGVPSTVARRLGIDEIALRSGQLGDTTSLLPRQSVAGNLRGDTVGTAAGSAASEIITIGKRVNEAFSISYEQALSGAGNVVQFSYQLSRRISLVARAGTENTLDMVFSFAFD